MAVQVRLRLLRLSGARSQRRAATAIRQPRPPSARCWRLSSLKFVFDGRLLPGKEAERSRRTERKLAAVAAALGSKDEVALVKAQVHITEELVHAVQGWLLEQGLIYIVAPFEADAQMAMEFRAGRVYAVLTEDSDLLVYGCLVPVTGRAW